MTDLRKICKASSQRAKDQAVAPILAGRLQSIRLDLVYGAQVHP